MHMAPTNGIEGKKAAHPGVIDWEARWSDIARRRHAPKLQAIVLRFFGQPGVIGMHGGLPPAEAFPFTTAAFDIQVRPEG